MERVQSVNGFISSLPRIVKKKVWKVTDLDGTVVQYVSATDNQKLTAHKYINEKYPDRVLLLTFSHYKGHIAVPR
jgi:tricorn protease-like protein